MEIQNEGWHNITVAQRELSLIGISNEREDLVNMLGFHAFIKKDFDSEILEQAWNMILEYHDALRLRIKGGLVKKQIIVDYEYEKIPVVKANGFEGLMELEKSERSKAVRMCEGPLYRVTIVDCGNGAGGMVACIHNIAVDGYSLGLIFKEMEAYYAGALKGEAVFPKKKFSYLAYVKQENKYFSSGQKQEDYKWWRKKYKELKGYSLPAGRPSLCVETKMKTFTIGHDNYKKLSEICEKTGSSISSAVMSIMALTTCRLTGKKCFCFYNLSHGRWTFALKQTVGCMSQCNPVFFMIDTKKTFAETLKDDYSDYLQYLQHGRMSIVRHIWLAYLDSLKAGLNFYHNWMFFSPMELADISANSIMGFECFDESELENQFYSAVYDMPDKEDIQIDFNYQSKKFSDTEIENMLTAFMDILESGINNPDNNVRSLI